jgi:aspartate aminotransferase-like enzyme
METYHHSFSCGPTLVHHESISHYQEDFHPSFANNLKFFEIWNHAKDQVKKLVEVDSQFEVYFQSAESICGIWSCLNSILKPKDKIMIIENGYYSQKIKRFVESLDYECSTIHFAEDESSSSNLDEIKGKLLLFKPKLVICVHCETNSGILNPILDIGEFCLAYDSLLMVDFVSSAGAMEIKMQDWNVDFGILGTHKSLNLFPDLSIVVTSPRVQELICEVKYQGYDSLYQFRDVPKEKFFPYCPNWRAIIALGKRLDFMETEGFQKIYKNHEDVSKFIKGRIEAMGLELYAKYPQTASHMVTTVKLPKHVKWHHWNEKLLESGFLCSVGCGNLKKQVFRIGHLGIQANMKKAKSGMEIIEKVLKDYKREKPMSK